MKKLNLVRTIILVGSLLLQLSTLCFHSRGAAGGVDLSFDPGSGINGSVNAAVLQPDGKLIIGGNFSTVKGLQRVNLARLNADGSGDSSFTAEAYGLPHGEVYTLALQPDGKVLVGHQYGHARLNANGTVDTNFIAVIDTYYGGPNVIAVQSDGKILTGGFDEMTGIARYNSDGSPDINFNAWPELYAIISSFALQPDGKVLVGGQWSITGNTNNGIVRLNSDGSLDNSFSPGIGVSSGFPVDSVVLQPDGKVIIVGSFNQVNGTTRHGIARLNANGSLDNTFDTGTGVGTGYPEGVKAVSLQTDGKLVIAGNFATINGTNRNRIARLNANGSLDLSFNPGTGVTGNVGTFVRSLVAQADGKFFIGGSFTTINGTNRNYLARLNVDGSLDGAFQPGRGLNVGVDTMVVQADGKILLGGVLTFINGTNHYGNARLRADGSLDETFIPQIFYPSLTGFYNLDCPDGYQCYPSTEVAAIAVQPNGKVLIGGYALTRACANFEGGSGECTNISRYFLARCNADGTRDTSFEPALGSPGPGAEYIGALALQPDGKVIVAGVFSSIKGTNRNGIARLNANGSLDNSFDPGTGANGTSETVLQPDGKVLIAGSFTSVNGTIRNGIARLNSNGSLDAGFNPGTGANGSVYAMALQPDAKIFIGGYFSSVNGTNRNGIARLNADGSLDSGFSLDIGPDRGIGALALQPDGNVLIGGSFFTVNGVVRPRMARLFGNSPPPLNITRSNAFVIVSWPTNSAGYQLQGSTNISLTSSWSSIPQLAVTNAGRISAIIPATAGNKFFRLN